MVLSWLLYTLPLRGELVLTDVHSVFDGADTITYACGEGGVLLKHKAPATSFNSTAFTVSLNTGFPYYWYGVYTWPDAPNTTLLSGFYDGNGKAYGIVQFTEDGGSTWSNDTIIDAHEWGGGPIEFAGSKEGLMPSTSGTSVWRTSTGGRSAKDWVEVTPDSQNWHAGDYVWDGDGFAAIAGSSFCNSSDFGTSWACSSAEDTLSGMDGGIACSGEAPGVGVCLTGGGEISPAVAGWVHVSANGGKTWGPRALTATFPIRSVIALPNLLIAAGGNFFSAVGGVYVSSDNGASWELSLDLGQEVKACRALPIPALKVTRVWCVSAGQGGGSIVSADVKTA